MSTDLRGHGTGFLPDPDGHRYNGFHLHPAALRLRAGAALMPSSSIDDHAPPIWNQYVTGSCMGHGTAGAITTTRAAKGLPLRRPASPRVIYTLGRSVDRLDPSVPLQDVGATPNAVFRAIGLWGAPLEDEVEGRRSATDTDYESWLALHVNDELKLGELQAAHDSPIAGCNRLYETGSALRDAVVASLDDGYAVMAAVDASGPAFQSYSGGLLRPEGSVPNHWVYFTAQRLGEGERQIYMRNSWGKLGWGLDGCAWCGEDFITRGLFFPMVANLGL
jgi:hypothetical protein